MSLEDLFQKRLCICGHSIEEHEGKCYALDFNGIWSACRCPKFKPMSLIFKIERDEIPISSTNKTTSIKNSKPIKTPVIQWGGKKLLHSRS